MAKWICAFVLIVIGFTQAQAQIQGLGLRLGDPMGVSYKKYFVGGKSVEFVIGSASRDWHYAYYQDSFEEYSQFENDRYVSHSVQSTIYLQGRYLFDYPIVLVGMEGSLDWYWGVGAMVKAAKVRYQFQNALNGGPVETDIRNDVDFGPEGILGVEYTFDGTPMTVFGDGSLLIELLDRPAALRPFGALGVRINF